MKIRLTATLSALISVTAITAYADPLGWFKTPPVRFYGRDVDRRIEYSFGFWEDGSGELIVTPTRELPDEQLPAAGLVTVENQEYRFSQRKDKEGKTVLYASLPVGAIPVDSAFYVSVVVEDATGHRLVDTDLRRTP